MDNPDSSDTSDKSSPGIGIFILTAWHIFSLPFLIWAIITGPGGMICGPSDQFMVLFVGIPADIILLLVSMGRAAAKRKLIYLPLIINLAALAIIVLSGYIKPN